MQRAGLVTAQLALALAPYAQRIWLVCGPGNNGGDGLEAATHLHRWGLQPSVTWLGDEHHLPKDALASLQRARQVGVQFASCSPAKLTPQDLCIDALLGIGAERAPAGHMLELIQALNASHVPILALDVPSGLHADTGCALGSELVRAQHTLTLLRCKPGLFTAQGRDAAGHIWFDDLGTAAAGESACAQLNPPPPRQPRVHASHKGSYGDVAIIGGEGLGMRGMDMTGAALLAASAALHGGAGRVLVCLLAGHAQPPAMLYPELMLRSMQALDLSQLSVVCGCGGGNAVREPLPRVLTEAPRLILDADALNAISDTTSLRALVQQRATQNWQTVLTPHPLEAARLLGTTTAVVQSDRVRAAQHLATELHAVVALKGSGTIVAAPDHIPYINPTGNARLATAGTGDVLAGLIGAKLAQGLSAHTATCAAVYQHGACADHWPAHTALTASALASRLSTETA
jgi:hydroxyethylthiazole kinase-like uncharacterized protein yjeF